MISTFEYRSVFRYLPEPCEGLTAALGIAASAYLGGTQGFFASIAAYGGYKLLTKERVTVQTSETDLEKKLKTELFKRLPKGNLSFQQPISQSEFDDFTSNFKRWDLEKIRTTAIRACLHGKISEKELGYYMLYCMAKEMQGAIPGVKFNATCNLSEDNRNQYRDFFCKNQNIDKALLGDLSSKEDAFFIVKIEKPLDLNQRFHYTAFLPLRLYPFKILGKTELEGTIFLFSPHIYEKLLSHRYPENPEKPLFAIGTKEIETLSNNTQRVLSMTGGKTVPTPNIEANEALSLPFYLHDCYHLMIDSAIGADRPFWNGFGRRLIEYSKQIQDPNGVKAFRTLGQFCLDKEFESYLKLNKNIAFVLALVGMYKIAGKEQIDDQDQPFRLISDERYVNQVREELSHQFKIFWKSPAQIKRQDLTGSNLMKSVQMLSQIEMQDVSAVELKSITESLNKLFS